MAESLASAGHSGATILERGRTHRTSGHLPENDLCAHLITCYNSPYTIVDRITHRETPYCNLDINTSGEHNNLAASHLRAHQKAR